MTEELKQKAEEKYCKNCKLRQEQCLWAWRNTNGLDIPNEKNCSCKEVPAYITGATEATKKLQEGLEVAETWNKSLNAVNKELEANRDKYRNMVFDLQEQIEKMKSDSKTAYIKGIRTMANALKKYDREEGAWTDYFEHTVDKVLKKLLEEFGE